MAYSLQPDEVDLNEELNENHQQSDELQGLIKRLNEFPSGPSFPTNGSVRKKKPGRPLKHQSASGRSKIFQSQGSFENFHTLAVEDDGCSLGDNKTIGNFTEIVPLLRGIYEKLSVIENKLDKSIAKIGALEEIVKKQGGIIGGLRSDLKTKDATITGLARQVNNLEQQQRMKNLIITGDEIGKLVNGNGGLKTHEVVSELNKMLSLDLRSGDIEDVWKFQSRENSIIISVRDREIKHKIFSKMKAANSSKIFINEYLSSFNADLHFKLRQIKKLSVPSGINFSIYIRRGNLFVKFDNQERWISIRKELDLETVKTKLVNLRQ